MQRQKRSRWEPGQRAGAGAVQGTVAAPQRTNCMQQQQQQRSPKSGYASSSAATSAVPPYSTNTANTLPRRLASGGQGLRGGKSGRVVQAGSGERQPRLQACGAAGHSRQEGHAAGPRQAARPPHSSTTTQSPLCPPSAPGLLRGGAQQQLPQVSARWRPQRSAHVVRRQQLAVPGGGAGGGGAAGGGAVGAEGRQQLGLELLKGLCRGRRHLHEAAAWGQGGGKKVGGGGQ